MVQFPSVAVVEDRVRGQGWAPSEGEWRFKLQQQTIGRLDWNVRSAMIINASGSSARHGRCSHVVANDEKRKALIAIFFVGQRPDSFSLDFIGFHWISLDFIGFQWISSNF